MKLDVGENLKFSLQDASIESSFSKYLVQEINFQIQDVIKEPDEISIPLSVFKSQLSSLQLIVKYLREVLKLRFVEIAKLLNRDQRTIWCTYSNAKNFSITVEESEFSIPISIFQSRKLSVLESIVYYLKNKGLKNYKIAALLQKNPRTIWTVYSRALKKITNQRK